MSILSQLGTAITRESKTKTFWVSSALIVLLLVSLWPVTLWIAQTAHDQSRLFHALVVITLSIVILIRFGGVLIVEPFRLSASAAHALITAYSILALQFVLQTTLPSPWAGPINLLAIPAYSFALIAGVRFIFGDGTKRIATTATATLGCFLILSIFMEPLDWPLRTLAGEWSAAGLSLIGKEIELGLFAPNGQPPKLILMADAHPFHVASECNGFGVILSGILIGLLLATYQRLGIFDFLLNIITGFLLGFIFNIARILIIILLAPSLMEHYMLMHEIVGGITYWASLALIWVILKGPTRPIGKSQLDVPQSQSESM